MSAHNCAAAAALAKNAFFCLCDFMRGTIDSCMAKKLPPIAARNFAAVRPGHMCHMSHAFASKLAFRYRPSPKSQVTVGFIFFSIFELD